MERPVRSILLWDTGSCMTKAVLERSGTRIHNITRSKVDMLKISAPDQRIWRRLSITLATLARWCREYCWSTCICDGRGGGVTLRDGHCFNGRRQALLAERYSAIPPRPLEVPASLSPEEDGRRTCRAAKLAAAAYTLRDSTHPVTVSTSRFGIRSQEDAGNEMSERA